MYIERYLEQGIMAKWADGRAVIIYGPRRVGKTTLLKQIKSKIEGKTMLVNGEDAGIRSWLASQSVAELKSHLAGVNTLMIDEAQRVEQVGLNIKLIVDNIAGIKVVATGSSSFELANQVGEPLVGRKWSYYLLPLAQLELGKKELPYETKQNLAERLVYGGYPEVVTERNVVGKEEILGEILDSYLFKDLLEIEEIKRSDILVKMLKMLAFQIGDQVSWRELSNSLGIGVGTVERYLDLLEKVYVIKRLGGYSGNLRQELTKTGRYYFVDLGIRNAVVNNFNNLETRNDVGQLWENYLFMERLKRQSCKKIRSNIYFWRTYDQQEIDLVEEREGKLFGFEFKWGKKIRKAPKIWLKTYANAEYEVINQENYLEFVG